MRERSPNPMLAGFADMQAGYHAAKRSGPFKRRRTGIPVQGAGADYHYASEADYLWMTEVARDLDRNDCVIGQMIDRACDNILQSGFSVDPETGDEGLNDALKTRACEEFESAEATDLAGELTFAELERLTLRETFVAGDVFLLPQDGGLVQQVENHLCRSATGKQKSMANVVLGIEMDPATRRRQRYWFTREPIAPTASKVLLRELRPIDAYDASGEANVWHMLNKRRPTQTRGVTALAPCIDLAGMHDDLQFAALLKAQLSAFFLTVHNREKGFFDSQAKQTPSGVLEEDSTSGRVRDKLAPGSAIKGGEAEKIEAWSPNIPNAEFFPHMRLVLTLLSINLGLPLVLALLDASETNFSGFRGAIDQARIGFRRIQRALKTRFHQPYWRFKIHAWQEDDAALRKAVADWVRRAGDVNPFKAKWNAPAWAYLEPAKDATSDLIRVTNMLTSPTRQCAERGVEWAEIVRETITDRQLAITAAVEAAQKINKQFGLAGGQAVNWRDLAPLPAPERMAISMQVGEDPPAKSPAGAAPATKGAP